jgi:hypothetical protein
MKLHGGFKRIFWLVLGSSFCTGASFFVFDQWVRVPGILGPEHSPFQKWIIRAHVTSDYLLLLSLGYLIRVHIQPGLKGRRHRRTGLGVMTALGVMMASSLPILYAADGDLRSSSIWIHTYLGLSIPLILGLHLWQKRRKTHGGLR